MNECEREGIAGNCGSSCRVKFCGDCSYLEEIKGLPWKRITSGICTECFGCESPIVTKVEYWVQYDCCGEFTGLEVCDDCYEEFVIPIMERKAKAKEAPMPLDLNVFPTREQMDNFAKQHIEPVSTLEEKIVNIWDEYKGFKRPDESEPVSLAEKRRPLEWFTDKFGWMATECKPFKWNSLDAEVLDARIPDFGYRNYTGAIPEYTHCATFEFPNGDIVEIPKPDKKEGWFFQGSLEMEWPHQYWINLEKEFRLKCMNPKHDNGWLIAKEYCNRIEVENPRIVNVCTYVKVIVIEKQPADPETYDAVKNFPLLSGYGLNR